MSPTGEGAGIRRRRRSRGRGRRRVPAVRSAKVVHAFRSDQPFGRLRGGQGRGRQRLWTGFRAVVGVVRRLQEQK